MRSSPVIIIFAIVAQGHANELTTNRTSFASHGQDSTADEFVDDLVDKLVIRALVTRVLHCADVLVDYSMLGKPSLLPTPPPQIHDAQLDTSTPNLRCSERVTEPRLSQLSDSPLLKAIENEMPPLLSSKIGRRQSDVRKPKAKKRKKRKGFSDEEDELPLGSDAQGGEAMIYSEVKFRFCRMMDSVVKVFAAIARPSHDLPWTTETQEGASGSAFSVSWSHGGNTRWLLTNSHCVHHAAVVEVRKRGDHKKYIARVVCIGLECDLALLTVDDEVFWQGLPSVELAKELPNLQDEVTVVGFPVGGDNTCITMGVVSRIDMSEYSGCGHKQLLVIQIDAAINPGNSGGPCFATEWSEGKPQCCVGIAFQGLHSSEAENVGYIIPTEVIDHFLQDFARNGVYTGFGHGGFQFQVLENAGMRASLGLRKTESGVRVKRVDAGTPAGAAVKKGDVLMQIDGQVIGNDGKVPFRDDILERIDVGYVASRKYVNDSCKLRILRGTKKLDVDLKLTKFEELAPRASLSLPQYFIYGGCVFVPLSEPLLRSLMGTTLSKDGPMGLIAAYYKGVRKHEEHQVVVLSQVLASPLTVGFTNFVNTAVKSCNGVELENLKHLIALVEKHKGQYVIFELDTEDTIVLPKKEVQAQGPQILKENMIPHDRSVHFRIDAV